MKNLDFFNIFSFVDTYIYFSDLFSSYHWNTKVKWSYCYRVNFGVRYGHFEIYVYHRYPSGNSRFIYIIYLSVNHGIISVFDIQYSPQSTSLMKFSPDELMKSVPFLLGKFRSYKIFLDTFSLAAKVLDKEFFSCV